MKLPSHFVTNATTVASDFTMTRSESLANFAKTLSMLAITLTLSLGLTGCEYFQTQTDANSPIGANQIAKLIPKRGQDSKSWAQDINQIFDTLKIEKTRKIFVPLSPLLTKSLILKPIRPFRIWGNQA